MNFRVLRRTIRLGARALLLTGCTVGYYSLDAAPAAWTDRSAHHQGFVTANGVKLQYLDWGGNGPALILLAGLGENPHIYDDLAPAFTDRFRVLSYARRGHDRSEAKPPYDTVTLTEDLRGFMDALHIARAKLVGWSLGGNEITWMAQTHPDLVLTLTYLDAAYDWSDPQLKTAYESFPAVLAARPPQAMALLDNYRRYQKAVLFPDIHDMDRIEAYIRESVIIQPDGSVRERMPTEREKAFYDSLWSNPHLDYTKVKVPVLAIYASSTVDEYDPDPSRRSAAKAWESGYMNPFREARIQHDIPATEILLVHGRHNSFFLPRASRWSASCAGFQAK